MKKALEPKFGKLATKRNFHLGNHFERLDKFTGLQSSLARAKTFVCLLWQKIL